MTCADVPHYARSSVLPSAASIRDPFVENAHRLVRARWSCSSVENESKLGPRSIFEMNVS